MGLLKTFCGESGKAVGSLLGKPFEIAGDLTDSETLTNIGKDISAATSETGKLVGNAVDGIADIAIGAVTLDTEQIQDGLLEVGNVGVRTAKGIVSGTINTLKDSRDLIEGVVTLDGEKTISSARKLATKAIVASIAISIADALPGDFDDDSKNDDLDLVFDEQQQRGFNNTADASVGIKDEGFADTVSVVNNTDGGNHVTVGAAIDVSDDDMVSRFGAAVDANGDSEAEADKNIDRSKSTTDQAVSLSGGVDTASVEDLPSFEPNIEIFGNPLQDIDLWDRQDDPNSCAVATTNSMFRSLGLDPGEGVLSDIFQEYGIYDPYSGTNPYLIDDAINDLAGRMGQTFRAEEINNFTEDGLKEILQSGARPLIAIDAHDLYPEYVPPGSGHAVQLVSIITENDQSFAVINDPGSEEGAGKLFPLDTFFEAARTFSNTAIVMAAA